MKNHLWRFALNFTVLAVSILFFTTGALAEGENEPEAEGVERSFICSAYYSPLPGQGRYTTGSYAGDIRLNGSGVRGASGMEVFPGMVAAPPNFPFGTKLFIPGIGMTTVADRGGAIKGNRLDIWFGHGEEALGRALQFGKRPCLVTMYGLNEELQNSVGFSSNVEPAYARLAEDPFRFKKALKKGSDGESVGRLQQFLKDMGYFSGKVTNKYDDATVEAVKAFQIDQGILDAPSVEVPGGFGSTTIQKFEAVLATNREKYWEKVPNRNLGRGAEGDQVRKLQETLLLLGYRLSATGIYDAETVEAVYKFQLKEEVVKDQADTGAGYFGPATQAALDALVSNLDSADLVQMRETEEAASEDVTVEFTGASAGFLGLAEGAKGEEVTKLQELLVSLNYLKVEPTGYYGPVTKNAVFKLQQRYGLIKASNDPFAGRINTETDRLFGELSQYKDEFVASIKIEVTPASLLASARDLTHGMRGGDVKNLQEFLKQKGYFPGAYTTEYFGDVTKGALIEFQLDFGLIKSSDDKNAGRLTPNTKLIIKDLA